MAEVAGAPPELDLDSLLRFHGADSDDSDGPSPPRRRTLDDILNDNGSDSDSDNRRRHEPSTIRSPAESRYRPPEISAVEVSEAGDDEAAAATAAVEDRKVAAFGRRGSGELSSSLSVGLRGGSRSLPHHLLGVVVRANPRPGAALAAAAAASRSIPTPHAAAIKFRRASGSLALYSSEASEDDGIVSDATEPSPAELSGTLVENIEKVESSSSYAGEEEVETVVEEALGGEEVGDKTVELDCPPFSEETPSGNEDVVVAEDGVIDEPDSAVSEAIEEENGDLFLSLDIHHEVNDEVTDLAENDSTNPVSDVHAPGGNDPVESGDVDVNVVREDVNSRSETKDSIEELLENYWMSGRRSGKKDRNSKKPLQWAEEIEKRLASSGLHWEEGAAAQPMRLEGIHRGPPAVGYLQIDDNNALSQILASLAFKREHGTARVLAVHMNFIAVGMSRGFVLVMPCKYSAHYPDIMDAKMLMLATSSETSPVSSLCFNQQGNLLLAGYCDGHFTVWDVLKTTVVKTVTGDHRAPVVHTLFLSQESQGSRQFQAVTGDCKGVVRLHTFHISIVPLGNPYTVKSQGLLDGEGNGIVFSASSLMADDFNGAGSKPVLSGSTSASVVFSSRVAGGVGGEAGRKFFSEGSSAGEEGVVVFATHRTALVVRLSPSFKVYAQLPRPDGVHEGSIPYTAWKFRSYSPGSSNETAPTEASDCASFLALAWDRRIQVAKLVKSELKLYKEWQLDSAAIGVAWLDENMLVVLTSRGQYYLFSREGTEIHRASLAKHGCGEDEMITYHTQFINAFGNPEKAYHNSLAVRGATIYLLGPGTLVVSRLLPWKERIQELQRAGDWMGALDMAMRLYDGQAHGVIDLPKTSDAIRDKIMPHLEELIILYVDEVFSYIAVAFSNQTNKVGPEDVQKKQGSSVQSEIENQYARVGGVAVEFYVHIKRTDILFDEIFSRFAAVEQGGTFLELLEPYILKDMLGCLPPEIMQALVEHYSSKGWLQRVEQCVLHMDISSLDFNQVVKLCREHGLHGALIYLFNRGLNDFRAPLEELFLVLIHNHRKEAVRVGYRMLVYLKYCFSGLAFPPGHGTIPPPRLQSLRIELLQYLLEESNVLNLQVEKSVRSSSGFCPNLCHLLWLDTEATLEVLRYAFADVISQKKLHPLNGCANIESDESDPKELVDLQMVLQDTVNALIQILDVEISEAISSSGTVPDELSEVWPSNKDIGNIYEFISFFISCKAAVVPNGMLNQILEYLTSELDSSFCIGSESKIARKQENEVLALLEVTPQDAWDSNHLLERCKKTQFHQVCGFIYETRGEYINALEGYMEDTNEPIHAFTFINSKLLQLRGSELFEFRSAVKDLFPKLISLSREGTLFVVLNHYSEESNHILVSLQAIPKCQFLYLKTLVEAHLFGTVDFSCFERKFVDDVPHMNSKMSEIELFLEQLSHFPKLLQQNPIQVTDELAEHYLELLCQYERSSVLKFLETFENYRLEHCLRLCLDHEVTDAAAFLLERVGDVGSALSLTMSSLRNKLHLLDVALEKKTCEPPFHVDEKEQLEDILRMEEARDLLDLIHASVSLCQRNTLRLDSFESEPLWFRLLDSFCQPLRDLYNCKIRLLEGRHNGKAIIDPAYSEDKTHTSIYIWKISKSRRGTHLMQRILSQFIREIIEGMVGYVPLPAIMTKLLSDNDNHEFGDFKLTILEMLGIYSFERRILDTAKSLIEDDTYYAMSLLKKGAFHSYAPHDVICCVCHSSLVTDSSSSSVRVFSCGHATHVHCEFGNGALGQDFNAGCPLCAPKKNKSTNEKVLQNGLIESHVSRDWSANTRSVLHNLHEFDMGEKPYGLHQMSRFEILNNLGKAERTLQMETIPPLRLAPPAIYHERVEKTTHTVTGESSNVALKPEPPSRMKTARDLRTKASAFRFLKKESIFSGDRRRR